ncbi:hypothetical protein M2263_001040 [Providencia alcalifaciens]|nr:hypothetical protein [Providencia alcalifaciens]
MLIKYANDDKYSINGPIEIRITDLDHVSDLDINRNVEPALSVLKPIPDRLDIDCAIWFNILTMSGTRGAEEFYAEFEQWLYDNLNNDTSIIRVEWSKGWGYTSSNAWVNDDVIKNKIPNSYTIKGNEWNDSILQLKKLDPHGVFSTYFVEKLLKPTI